VNEAADRILQRMHDDISKHQRMIDYAMECSTLRMTEQERELMQAFARSLENDLGLIRLLMKVVICDGDTDKLLNEIFGKR
jgi:uncharacterized membrane-anchored protein YhcB (DUF1043 family)